MISVIIVGYNSKEYLDECLSSLFHSTYRNFRLIFVDNNSSDNTAEFIKDKFPNAILLESDKNLGFAGGNNLGIKKAMEFESDYIFLLNPDTIIDKECLALLIKKADQQTILQPLILLHENGQKTNLINTTGGCLNFLGFSYCSDYKMEASTARVKNIALASGAAVLIPISAIKKTGVFDESFFMYHEDVDLFWRARIDGYNIQLAPESLVWHKYSFSRNPQKMFYSERNRLIFLYKNFSTRYIFLIFLALAINEILMILYSILTGWFTLKINSYFSAIKLIRADGLRKNSSVKKSKMPNCLKKFIQPEISFSEVNMKSLFLYNMFLRTYYSIINKSI
jgi:GT2 family glycosyltransferase